MTECKHEAPTTAHSSPRKVGWKQLRQACAYDFRALLRLKVRTRALAVKQALEPMLS
jgi:hypothetical protein